MYFFYFSQMTEKLGELSYKWVDNTVCFILNITGNSCILGTGLEGRAFIILNDSNDDQYYVPDIIFFLCYNSHWKYKIITVK